ncbi:hypothetical protein AW224_06880, partial [Campylobacter jejuni]
GGLAEQYKMTMLSKPAHLIPRSFDEYLGSIKCFRFLVQAEDGIREAKESSGLGDVYKRQVLKLLENNS